jgi:hypothetical protein
MHLKSRSSGTSIFRRASVKGVAEAVLGTDQRGQRSVYDTRSGTLLTIILLFVVGWIPMVGQMVAGFVGGRRAGSPFRGFIAAFVGTMSVLFVLFVIVESIRGINSALINDPEGEIAVIAASSPFLQQMLSLFLDYSRELFGSADFSINYATYMITIPFGIIGGIFADQAQKETRIIVTRTGKATARRVRSIEAYKEGKQLGFESFEQYSKMSVNTMAPVSRPVKDEVPVNSARKPTVRKKESPVTATVDTTRVQSTPTSSVTPAQKKKKEQEGESIVYI